MKNKSIPKASKLLPVMGFVLFILLPVLAFFQYNWIGELSEREKEHLKHTMETSAVQFSMKFQQDFFPIQQNFLLHDTLKTNNAIIHEINNRLKLWEKNQNTQLLKKIYFLDLENDPIYYLIDQDQSQEVFSSHPLNEDCPLPYNSIMDFYGSYNINMPNMIHNNMNYLFLPLRNSQKINKIIVLELNSDYILNEILGRNFHQYFPLSKESNIILIVNTYEDSTLFINDMTFIPKSQDWYDVKIPIGLLPPVSSPLNMLPDSLNMNYRNYRETRPVLIRNYDSTASHLPLPLKPWSLLVGLKSGTLDSEINSIRTRNLIISFSILLLLAFVNMIILIISSNAKKLAHQQMQFVAGVSHELRTPLTVIRTASENLSDGLIDEKRATVYGRLIKEESDKLWEMLETTLMFAGIQSNKQVFNMSFLNIEEVISKSIHRLKNLEQLNNVKINVNIEKELPAISADENALTSALQNLIINAIKFNKNGGKVDIKVIQDTKIQLLIISITDNGRGIPSRDLKFIFEPFFRSKEVIEDNIYGNGIGLTLVKQIIEAHGGKISAESKFKEGSVFTITLPFLKS